MSINSFEQPLAVLSLESLEGTLAVCRVSQTRPPGARVSVSVALENAGNIILHGKVTGQVRLSPDVLRMSIRLNNLAKNDRALLMAHLAAGSADTAVQRSS